MRVNLLDKNAKKLFLQDVVKNWEKEDPGAIAERWGVERISVAQIVSHLRKKGVNLSKKVVREKPFYTDDLIGELNSLIG